MQSPTNKVRRTNNSNAVFHPKKHQNDSKLGRQDFNDNEGQKESMDKNDRSSVVNELNRQVSVCDLS